MESDTIRHTMAFRNSGKPGRPSHEIFIATQVSMESQNHHGTAREQCQHKPTKATKIDWNKITYQKISQSTYGKILYSLLHSGQEAERVAYPMIMTNIVTLTVINMPTKGSTLSTDTFNPR